ncbi:hypothetical protein T7987_01735 [Sulfitobacter faviae]|uniref:Dihydroxy-acid dehydratase n=1 Tax=Sulfitobacter faviae TaxID=1775881 RepID=A0ABZ0UZE7_9RHOB|nr:hypothetical protein [Sulfitobacter faviae]WPZ21993.1 hypothetical protein T7987_01735 [Sulfitobacter faviae]
MITWTSKSPLVALAMLTLSACEGGQGFSFGGRPATPEKPLLQTALAGGAVQVVPPQGYCIDPKSLKRRFALMARCDALGLPDVVSAAPRGILTLALIEAEADAPLPTPQQVAEAAGLSQLQEAGSIEGASIFVAQGPVPAEGMSPRHWRGTARIGGHVASVTLYGAPQSRAISEEGRALVAELIQQSRSKSATPTAPGS